MVGADVLLFWRFVMTMTNSMFLLLLTAFFTQAEQNQRQTMLHLYSSLLVSRAACSAPREEPGGRGGLTRCGLSAGPPVPRRGR